MKTSLVVLVSALLCSACTPTLVVPDPSIPHQLAADAKGVILVKHPNGQVERQEVRLPAGGWYASPQVVDPVSGGGGKPSTPPKQLE
jgi:hypothetical protein